VTPIRSGWGRRLALDAARADGWVVIEMKRDWHRVFPPDPAPGR